MIFAPTPANLAAIAATLQAGELAALPTETVYGLAADATNPKAVLKIYATKGRPRFNPLIVHVPDLATAQQYGQFNAQATALAQAFWPGPLTLVVPYPRTSNIEFRTSNFEHRTSTHAIPDIVRAGLPSLALRVPAHPLMQQVLQVAGCPLAAPSANKSGHVSATQAAHVAADFGPELPILEGGPCPLGLESTIVDCTTAMLILLRHGALTAEKIEQATTLKITYNHQPLTPNAPQAPGMLLQHYAPKAPVRLNVTHLEPGEALLAFGDSSAIHKTFNNHRTSNIEHRVSNIEHRTSNIVNLSPTANLAEAALNLFAMLRELDALHPTAIAVMPIPNHGLGEAITDRLNRAAAGR